MRYKFLFLLVCLVLFPFGVKADCDYQRKADLRSIASNIQFNNSYILNEDNYPIFTVEISNITPDIYIKDNHGNIVTYDSNKTFEGYDGVTLTYDIYSGDPNCYGYKLDTKYVNLQAYNKFFTFDECRKYPEFNYCKLWMNNDFSYNYFKKLLSDYKKNNFQEELVNDDEERNYIVYVAIGLLLIVVVIIVLFVVRRIKNER